MRLCITYIQQLPVVARTIRIVVGIRIAVVLALVGIAVIPVVVAVSVIEMAVGTGAETQHGERYTVYD